MEKSLGLEIPIKKLALRITLRILLVVCLLLFAFLLMPRLLKLLLPFILALLAAKMFLAPIIEKISKKLGRVRKLWSVLLVILMLVAILSPLIVIVYYLASQIIDLLGNLSTIKGSLIGILNGISGFISERSSLTSLEAEVKILDLLQRALGWLTENVSSYAPSFMNSVGDAAPAVVNFFVALVFFIIAAYFTTVDYPNVKKALKSAIPRFIRPQIEHIRAAAGSAMFGYLKAQLILSCLVALVSAAVLLMLRQKFAVLIALAIGLVDLLPFFGGGIVLIPWAIVTLIQGNAGKAVLLLGLAFALFMLRRMAEPKVVGNQTGLHPLLGLICIYVGMKLGGVLGMIFAPVVCMAVISLYRVGFFQPAIDDFQRLFSAVCRAASLP